MKEITALNKIKIKGTNFYIRSQKDESVLRIGFENNNYQLPDSLDGLVVVDIGAFIGGISILCAKRGAIVYCAEPSKDNFELLKKNIGLNRLKGKINATRVALGKGKTRLLDINYTNRASNVLQGLDNSARYVDATEEVETQTLKEFFIKNNIKKCDILKLDCEGAEIEVLDDLVDMEIPLIVCELHSGEISRTFDEKLTRYTKIELGGQDIKYIHI